MISISDRIQDSIRSHDYDKYLSALEDMTNPENENAYEEYCNACINNRYGHYGEKHTAQTYMDLIQRIIHDRVDVSLFNSKEDAAEFIDMAIFNKSKSIAQWMTGDRETGYGPDAARRNQWSTNIDFKEPIGRGFDENFREKETSVMTIVLNRTLPGEPGPGFVVQTAYPNIKCKEARATGKILDLDFIKKQDTKDQISPLYYSYLQMKREKAPNEQMQYMESSEYGKDDSYIRYDFFTKGGEHFSANLSERKDCQSIKYSESADSKVKKLTLAEAAEKNPSFVNRLEAFKEIIRKENKTRQEKDDKKRNHDDDFER